MATIQKNTNNKDLIQIGKGLNYAEIHKKATKIILESFDTAFPAKHLREHFGVTHKRVLDAFKGKAPILLVKINNYVNTLVLNSENKVRNTTK